MNMAYGTNLVNDYNLIAYGRIVSAIPSSISMFTQLPSRENNAKLRNTFAHIGEVIRMLTTFGA
jgi:hypothetical protein